MVNSLEKAADMEAGQAGYPATQASFSCSTTTTAVGQLSPRSTDSSTKPPNANAKSPCTPSSLASLWTTVSSAPSRLGRWASRLQQRQSASQIVRTLDSCPRGYPNLAAFLDSDECFSVYRRFGFLQSRLLLDKQDKLRRLEDALDKLDRREAKKDHKRPMTTDLLEEDVAPRQKLLANIEKEFTSYANVLDTASKMMALNRPSEADYASVHNYMNGDRSPLIENEASWVFKKEDLITLRAGREHAWLDSAIEKILKWFHCPTLEMIFGDEHTRQKSLGNEVYYSRQKIANLASSIITLMVLILLVVPIYLLYHLMNEIGQGNGDGKIYATCLGILLVSTLAFSAVLCLFTRAKRHEILAAAAAYCAVLVVFFGNIGPTTK